ncbi:DUF1120 domain-containing protein [Ralstonia sp. UBA689]|uniref:DUF1120 domain-containing protein n=1 Tax=Ralstonia sp. UBA689 TaxID=1947373 RepID=UPI0025CBFE82|nr:DUF1120 domain-containing protein [Ralstonia sp. UBA689]
MQIQTLPKALMVAAFGSLFAVGALSAFAQDTADLAVKGTIVPTACSASFSGGDTVDFGTIKVADLLDSSYHSLGLKITNLHVQCSSDKAVHIQVSDVQSGTAITDKDMVALFQMDPQIGEVNMFGLGSTTVDGKSIHLGSYTIRSMNRSVDGLTLNPIYSDDDGVTWVGDNAHMLAAKPSRLNSLGRAQDTLTPVAGKEFIFPLQINAALNHGARLQVAQDVKLNGQAVFTINYE